MKLTCIFAFLSISIVLAADTYAQKTSLSMNVSDRTLAEVLEDIESRTDFQFFYNSKLIDMNRRVSVNVDKTDVLAVLDQLFDGSNIRYKIVDKDVILTTASVSVKSPSTLQEDRKVAGTVTDEKGEPIIGANIVLKDSPQIGTITDVDGKFTLSAPEQSVLVVSYIGYLSKEIAAGDKDFVNVVLVEDTKTLDEVVVVGYGVQKKVNVIGSIASVDSKKLESRVSSNLSNMLTGQLSGVTITQSKGNPGQDKGTIRVRGVGSFGATPEPLVLVDGLPGSLNDLNPADIESISVLKDASSAAIYGSRAANGVVLIKTKEGSKGKISVTYNGYAGFNQATELPDMCDSWEYAELYNKAVGKDVYKAEDIQKYKDGTDPYNYPNERYLDELLGGKGLQTGHELTLNGGSEKVQYMFSGGYLRQNGLTKYNSYERYNGRFNFKAELTKDLSITARLGGITSKREEPSTPGGMDAYGVEAIVSNSLRFPGLWPTRLKDGSFGLGPKVLGTPLSWLDSNSFINEDFDKFNSNVELAYSPLKGLTLKAIGGYNYTGHQERHYRSAMEVTGGKKIGPSFLSDKMYKTVYKTFQGLADYNVQLDKHSLSLLAGYTWEEESQRSVGGERKNFPSDKVPYLDAGGADGQINTGGGYDWAIMSFFGRVGYNYDQRYLVEATMRYDGSSRFPTDSKFGLFPSVAVGWRLSEEAFFKDISALQFVSNLKIKASYGQLGNNNIGNYPYQSTYTLSSDMNYVIGGVYKQGAAVTTYVDPTLKWERTQTTDFGLETAFWNNKLTFSASYFYRKTSDILYKPNASYSSIFGLTLSQVNTGSLENKGWEFELGHQNKIGGFSYFLSANFSIIKNKVLGLGVGDVKQKSGMIGNGVDLFIDYPMEMFYGYQTDGVFLSDEEVKNWHNQGKIAPNSKAGDLRYVDRNGDNIVDEADKTYLGSKIPKYTFGFNLGGAYKSFDFNVLFQGAFGVKGLLTNYAGYAFFQEGSIQRWQAAETWSNNPQNRYPLYPRLEVMSNAGSNNTLVSDFWILNASYLKIRNVQLGYTLPSHISRKLGASNLRLYTSLENPLSFNSYRKGWDPEINTSGNYYPILSTYTFGLTLKF